MPFDWTIELVYNFQLFSLDYILINAILNNKRAIMCIF